MNDFDRCRKSDLGFCKRAARNGPENRSRRAISAKQLLPRWRTRGDAATRRRMMITDDSRSRDREYAPIPVRLRNPPRRRENARCAKPVGDGDAPVTPPSSIGDPPAKGQGFPPGSFPEAFRSGLGRGKARRALFGKRFAQRVFSRRSKRFRCRSRHQRMSAPFAACSARGEGPPRGIMGPDKYPSAQGRTRGALKAAVVEEPPQVRDPVGMPVSSRYDAPAAATT